jgi:hypothetical protein
MPPNDKAAVPVIVFFIKSLLESFVIFITLYFQ